MKYKKEMIDLFKFLGSSALIFLALFAIINYVPFIARYDHYVIVTGSMEPVISVGDVVIVDNNINYDELEKGMIISFKVDINNDGIIDTVVHYLDEILETQNGEKIYRTKPEISDQQDPWSLEDSDITGVYKFQIGFIGRLLLFAQSGLGKLVIIVDILVIYLLFYFLGKPPKKNDEIEENSETTDEIIEETKESIDEKQEESSETKT